MVDYRKGKDMGKIKRFFSDHTETKENHELESLQTRYYKVKNDVLMKKIEELINGSNKYKLLGVSIERGEISANIKKPQKGLIVFTVVSVRPFRTAVDLSVSFDTLIGIDFGRSQRVIQSLYTDIDKHFEYVGSGLSSNL
jgi:hypothetical protein